jgi:hypothetical protein
MGVMRSYTQPYLDVELRVGAVRGEQRVQVRQVGQAHA